MKATYDIWRAGMPVPRRVVAQGRRHAARMLLKTARARRSMFVAFLAQNVLRNCPTNGN